MFDDLKRTDGRIAPNEGDEYELVSVLADKSLFKITDAN